MKLLGRLIRYIRLHLFNNPKYFFSYIIRYFDPYFKLDIKYFEADNINSILETGRSIIRFGDGEVYLMNRGGLSFQKYEVSLRDLFFKIIDEYEEDSPYVLGLNRLPLSKTNRELKKHKLLSCWLPSKIYYHLYFNKKVNYFDASFFYYRDSIPKYFESYLLGKKLIFVANKNYIDMLSQDNNIPFKNIKYVNTPPTDAYSEYESIKAQIQKLVVKNGRENSVVLVSFGPAGKAIAFELAKDGIQVIDVGQGIEVAYKDKDHIITDTLNVL
ncbi:MAG: GT-D fold domain-containing glycosyltransferase [Candidatus Paceibacterota bacterium]